MEFILQPEPLTAESFAPFGELISVRGKPIMINNGTTERYHNLAQVTLGDAPQTGQGIISIFRAQPRTLPMNIGMMERHPLGSQAFLPSSDEPYLVLVCLSHLVDGAEIPDPSSFKLFLASDGEGVNYKANCWHHPLLALNKISDFWIVDRLGPGNNLQEFFFPEDWNITINLAD
ncbi:MAG: ureidoglycolate lyase [Saccharospirillaceae bacterium]|nr:ureidoglycolate lyase [Saccharospirillaceae bacterium]MCD8532443.1 ureidoglycolate lyase [Saccharospirillaceae bacterium]